MISAVSAQGRNILTAMAVCQILWLTGIWYTGGAASAWKLQPLFVYSFLCPFLVMAFPWGDVPSLRARMQSEAQALQLLVLLAVALLGGVYAYLQRGWPDESYVFAAAQRVVNQGVGPFFADYAHIPWLGTQHPPLAILIYSGALWLCGAHLFVLRLVALAFSLGILLITYRIGCVLYDRTIATFAAGALVVTPFFFRLGTTALNDVPLTFCFVLAVFLTLRLVATPSYKLAVGIGVCVGIGLLCKYTMVLIYPVLLLAVLLQGQGRRLWPHLLMSILVSVAIFAVWIGYAFHLGVVTTHGAVLGQHVRYVVAGRTGRSWLFGVLVFRLPSGIGVNLLPLFLLGGGQLFWRRRPTDWFVLSWILAVSMPLVLTLPGPRYFFPAFPAIALLIAHGVISLEGWQGRVVSLALLYWGAALYLFIDWERAAGGLFVR